MRKLTVIVAAAAAILAGAVLTSNPARADYNGGGPIKKGKMCWVATSGVDHGYWRKCPPPAKAMKGKKKGMKKKAMKKK